MLKLRPSQQAVYQYTGGKMGVVAVPGSGKTFTLSMLAAKLVAGDFLQEDQEVLIVTYTNSAVNNFKQRIAVRLKELGLPPGMRYRVRTLHGIANDLIDERLDLAGLPNRFEIFDGLDQERARQAIAHTWSVNHPNFGSEWQVDDLDDDGYTISKNTQKWDRVIEKFAEAFIGKAKDLLLSPDDIRQKIGTLQNRNSLLEMGCDLYEEYQRSLSYAFAVDFQDLVGKALKVLQADPEFLERMRHTWPYILEDEAQDSNALQEQILRTLVGESGNWVRVGDPNQAIYATFTTANPNFLRSFLAEPGVTALNLPASGRSVQSIINLANQLSRWVRVSHPVDDLRDALALPEIRPVDDPTDEQPNPPDQPDAIKLIETKYSPAKERENIVRSLAAWLPDHQDWTVAVLVLMNAYGAELITELKKQNIPFIELLKNTSGTRQVTEKLWAALNYLSQPINRDALRILYDKHAGEPSAELLVLQEQASKLILSTEQVEDYLMPRPGGADRMAALAASGVHPAVQAELMRFRDLVQQWQKASILPVDQLVLTIAQDLFTTSQDLAVAHKLALLLEYFERTHPDATLADFANELKQIIQNRRGLSGFDVDDDAFNPDMHRGKVVVTTMHKAKGLEWDRVYLASVNNYDFPSAQPYDTYKGEVETVNGRICLHDEGLARLKALAVGDIAGIYLPQGYATQQSHYEQSAERLRLLYVGITRAKRELIITWNSGKYENSKLRPALPLTALQAWQKELTR